MNKYEWLNKKTPRSVDQLKLWPENPRLNPEEKHIYLSDFAEDMTSEESDKKQFFKLVKSIVEDGFIPADPIIVWKENEKYFVAEGNRRILVLKLLREPTKAPKSIRSFMKGQAGRINSKSIEKIYVNVAPSFGIAEWYINQRNSTSSLQQHWTRVQQQRWIAELYEKYDGDIDKIESITKMTKGELENFIRILKIKDLVKLPEIKEKLSETEYQEATSYKFPITILERFFSKQEVKDKWGIDFDGIEIKLKNRKDFLNAYIALIRHIINKDSEIRIDTRTITNNFDEIFSTLPAVNLEESDSVELLLGSKIDKNDLKKDMSNVIGTTTQRPTPSIIKNDPNRNKIILPIYNINSSSYRLNGLFNELKGISLKYINVVAASIRIFLDLAILNYIETEELENNIKTFYRCDLRDVTLKKRLEYIKNNKLTGKSQTIVNKLLDESTQYSLDVLNGYMHRQDSHYLTKQFLNGFWDFLFPLFNTLMVINEDNN
jgi:hypothetical protein